MEIDQTHNIPLAAVSMAFLLVVIAAFGAVWMFAFNVTDNDGVNENNSGANGNDTATDAPLGSAANPVVVDDVDDDNGHATNNNNARNSNNSEFWERNDGITPLLTSARRILNNLSPMHFLIGTGFILPISLIIPILMDGGTAALLNDVSNNNTLQLSMLAFLAHSIMAVGAYRLLRQVLNNPDVGTYPGTRQGGRSRRTNGRRHTVGDIEGMIRKVPVEEFVSEEEVSSLS